MISGGQTGVDRAALDAAISAGLACGGYCPRGRLAEDGAIPLRYPLTELDSDEYDVRTRRNVETADATLILARDELTGGTLLTAGLAEQLGKPLLAVRLGDSAADSVAILDWLSRERPAVLNVAGPRESTTPGVYRAALDLLEPLFTALARGGLPPSGT